MRLAVCLLFAVIFLRGQGAKFEAASIRPSSPDARASSILSNKAGLLRAENAPVRALITLAYGIRDFQLSGGPGWVGTDRYDVMAKPEKDENVRESFDPGPMTDDPVRDDTWKERLQNLLEERFGLVLHKEMREAPIYVLTVAKGGQKLTVVTTPGDRQGMSSGRGRTEAYAATMSMLAMYLSRALGRPVVDKTGLSEKYDWLLEFDPNVLGSVSQDNATGEERLPTIFTALQDRLGLKLESAKGPVETYVIDRISKPSEN